MEPEAETNWYTVGSYLIVGIMEEAGQEILVIRQANTNDGHLHYREPDDARTPELPDTNSSWPTRSTDHSKTDSHKLFYIMENDPKLELAGIKL
jgi:hypothetical protein